jgi:hypothetical protein
MVWAKGRIILACCVFAAVLTAVNARADFASSRRATLPTDGAQTNLLTERNASESSSADVTTDSSWNATSADRLTPWTTPADRANGSFANSAAGASAQRVLTVPPGPDSTSLFFSALAGVGVWHLGKNVRKLSLSALPEWYHAGGPAQVGCATPIDLDFSLSAMQLCVFEGPIKIAADNDRGAIFEQRFEPRVRMPREDFSPNANPRGPPSYF